MILLLFVLSERACKGIFLAWCRDTLIDLFIIFKIFCLASIHQLHPGSCLFFNFLEGVVRSLVQQLKLCPRMLESRNTIFTVHQLVQDDDTEDPAELESVDLTSDPSVVCNMV